MTETITIERIGHLGDGIAYLAAGPVHIPFAAPGDEFIEDRSSGAGWRLQRAGPNRAQPPCSHYGQCGGCNMQHVAREKYALAKREWVIAALAGQGIEAPVDPLVQIAPASRRRATFAVVGAREGARLGFHPHRSNEVIDIKDCTVLRPALVTALSALKGLFSTRLAPGKEARASLTETELGLDLAIESKTAPKHLSEDEIAALRAAKIIRTSWNDEILFASTPVRLSLSGVSVDLPLTCFLQATAESERALTVEVVRALEGVRRIADLYSGIGTFTFALARAAPVDAFEGDEASVAALSAAARNTQGMKPISALKRDLARRPLMAAELKTYDGVVLDPPRVGAEAQARQLAKLKVARVAYVSCHPASFARDARILTEGGFQLVRVTPVDQFLWSHHIELVGRFER